MQAKELTIVKDLLQYCTSNKPSTLPLCGIYCEKLDNYFWRLVATDGHKFAYVDLEKKHFLKFIELFSGVTDFENTEANQKEKFIIHLDAKKRIKIGISEIFDLKNSYPDYRKLPIPRYEISEVKPSIYNSHFLSKLAGFLEKFGIVEKKSGYIPFTHVSEKHGLGASLLKVREATTYVYSICIMVMPLRDKKLDNSVTPNFEL